MSAVRNSQKGRCSINNEDLVESLRVATPTQRFDQSTRSEVACSSRNGGRFSYTAPTKKTPRTSGSNLNRNSVVDALVKQSMEQQKWLDEKRVKNVQAKSGKEARETQRMYQHVLDTENTFIQEIGDFIAKKDMLNQRKRELLHKRWTDNVNEPIRREVIAEMNSPNYHEFVRRKRELYKEYLEHLNRKGHVFLDEISPHEYYPLSLHPTRPSLLKRIDDANIQQTAVTRKLRDPLLQAERKRCAEERVVLRCVTGYDATDRDIAAISLPPAPLRPLGRHGTNCTTWTGMKLANIESPERMANHFSNLGITNKGLESLSAPDQRLLHTPPAFSMTAAAHHPKGSSDLSSQQYQGQADQEASESNTAIPESSSSRCDVISATDGQDTVAPR